MGRPFQCWFVTNDMRMVDLGGRPWRFRERERFLEYWTYS